MADLLILETEAEDNEQVTKVDKKSNKNKRKKRNRNKQNKEDPSIKTNNQKIDMDPNVTTKPIKKSKADSKLTNHEEEKKLVEELTITELSSKIDQENDHNLLAEVVNDMQVISIYQETKSECDKEDEHKLEKDLAEDIKVYNADKLESTLFPKSKLLEDQDELTNTQVAKITSSMSNNECEKIGNIRTSYDSNSGSNYRCKSNEKNKCQNYTNQYKNEYGNLSSPPSHDHKRISNSSDVVSLKSEEKYGERSAEKIKDQNLTNPTSETSSIKCSSVASQYDKVAPALVQNTTQNYNDGSEWITSSNKNRNQKNKKNVKSNKNNKKAKQNKNKAKPVKKQPQNQNTEEKKPNSIWDQDIEQNVLSVTAPEALAPKPHDAPKTPIKTEKSLQIKNKDSNVVKEHATSKGKF